MSADPGTPLARPLFDDLLEHLGAPREGVHGRDHVRRVLENGLTIAQECVDVDPVVVGAFAALHDACRLSDGRDPEHGVRAAELARRLVGDGVLPLTVAQLELLCAALRDHDRGRVSDDPTIGACWDADRLDLVRLGIQPRAELLSTDAAKAMAASVIAVR